MDSAWWSHCCQQYHSVGLLVVAVGIVVVVEYLGAYNAARFVMPSPIPGANPATATVGRRRAPKRK